MAAKETRSRIVFYIGLLILRTEGSRFQLPLNISAEWPCTEINVTESLGGTEIYVFWRFSNF